jgi:hypothetical protein
VCENRVLRRIFGSKRNEMTGGWRKLHYEELCDLYSLPSQLQLSNRLDAVGGKCSMGGKKRKTYMLSEGKPGGKRPLGRTRTRYGDNIKRQRREIESDDTDWIDLTQERDQGKAFVNAVMNLWFP